MYIQSHFHLRRQVNFAETGEFSITSMEERQKHPRWLTNRHVKENESGWILRHLEEAKKRTLDYHSLNLELGGFVRLLSSPFEYK